MYIGCGIWFLGRQSLSCVLLFLSFPPFILRLAHSLFLVLLTRALSRYRDNMRQLFSRCLILVDHFRSVFACHKAIFGPFCPILSIFSDQISCLTRGFRSNLGSLSTVLASLACVRVCCNRPFSFLRHGLQRRSSGRDDARRAEGARADAAEGSRRSSFEFWRAARNLNY